MSTLDMTNINIQIYKYTYDTKKHCTVIEIEPISKIKFTLTIKQVLWWEYFSDVKLRYVCLLDGYLGVLALIGARCGLYYL